MYKISFLQSHPIQYHSPLYDRMTQSKLIDLKVYYCTDYGLAKDGMRFHPELGELPNWDVDLVAGHKHEILENKAFKKGMFNGFFGLMNFSIYGRLKEERPDVLVINGWNYFTMVWAVFCCKLLKIKVYVRGDNSIEGDKRLVGWMRKIKHFLYGMFLFPLYTKISYVGTQNKFFFQSYGVKEEQLLHLPHAIDNAKFESYYQAQKNNKEEIRNKLGIPNKFNVLFIGRLHPEKRIFDLIEAVGKISDRVHLTIVGDGKLRNEVKQVCEGYPPNTFKMVGFKNQGALLDYYISGDLLVLPSQLETWGLVVNEAMNFNLPIILSNTVGSVVDLCRAENGYVYEMGDINDLSSKIDFLAKNPEIAKRMGTSSGEIIKEYSYDFIIENLIKSL